MNKFIGMGRLTKDPVITISQGQNETKIARFTLAIDRRQKNADGSLTADFLNCVAFGKTAEHIEKYILKGTKVVVTGRIQTGSYTNKEGQKAYTTDIFVEEIEFAESKASKPTVEQAPADGFVNIPLGVDDDGLPFT